LAVLPTVAPIAGGHYSHRPVMADEVVEALSAAAGHVAVDGTVGGGGHAAALLGGPTPPRLLIGLDRDPDAVAAAEARLARFGPAARVVHRPYSEMGAALEAEEWGDVGGVLLDLGVSSHQLDAAERGFSYRHEGPLD